MGQHVYYQLRERFDSHPAGVPERPEIIEILELLFTPEEAVFALSLPFAASKSAEDIARKTGLQVEEIIARCEQMGKKGLVFAQKRGKETLYALLPLAPGIFELSLLMPRGLNPDPERMAKLWWQYYENGWGHAINSSRTSTARVIPAGKALPFAENFFPYEDVSHYINKASAVALNNCICRVSQKKCQNPVQICMGLNASAYFVAEHNMGKLIAKEQAIDILNTAEEMGLVHVVTNTEEIEFLCNCCPCCCVGLGAITRLKNTVSHPTSNFVAAINADDCNGCRLCEEKCPVKAVSVAEIATVQENSCIGCGVCAVACPAQAVRLKRKHHSAEPFRSAKELYFQVAKEKGRLQTPHKPA